MNCRLRRSDELTERLKEYLHFRHVFRNVYLFRLEWERIKPLLLGAEQLVEDLNLELAIFIDSMDQRLAEDSSTESLPEADA